MKTYRIIYSAFDINGLELKHGDMRIRNCISKAHADVRLREYLIRKLPDFNSLTIYNCNEEYLGNLPLDWLYLFRF